MELTEENNCILYRHIRLDKNEVFYIGIAKHKNRPYESGNRRSLFWNKIVSKTKYEVEILFDNLSWEQAKEKEKEFINLYGRKDLNNGTLVNMTNGGDGVLGQIHSEETKKKRGLAITGEKHGMYGKTHTEELRAKWSKERSRENHFSAKKVLNTETNEVFNCIKDAAEAHSINYSNLCGWLNGSRPNRTNFIYI